MMPDRLQQPLPIDAAEIGLYVDVEHPVIPPAALTGLVHVIDRRSTGPVAVRVGVKHRFQARLQVPTGNLLSDAIRDRRDAQRARTTVCLRNIDPPHRRRKVAPRRQPIPQLVEVVRKINLERRSSTTKQSKDFWRHPKSFLRRAASDESDAAR